MYYAYILKSLKDSKYYYGSTENLKLRLKVHNSGKVRATRSRIPLRLHYYESFATRSEAMRREKFFKSIKGYSYLKEKEII